MALLGEIADNVLYFKEGLRPYRFVRSRRGYQSLRTLQRQKLVTVTNIGNRIEVALTRRGKMRINLERMRGGKRKLPKGHVTLVIFDFPESERTRRNLWRRYLKWFGFIQVQKSVWQLKYDVTIELAKFIADMGAGEWIRVFVAKEMHQ